METIDHTRQRDFAAVTGALFVGLFGLGFLISNVLATAMYPSPFDSAAKIEGYFAANRGEEQALALVQALAAVALLTFSAYVAAFVRRSTDETGALSWLALAGGVASSVLLLVCALSGWILSRPHTVGDPATLRVFHDLAYMTGGPGHVVAFAPFVGAASVAARRTKTLPTWIVQLGLVAAVPSLLSVLALIAEPAAYILPVARLLTFAWIAAVSLVLAFGRTPLPETETRPERDEASYAQRRARLIATADAPQRGER